MIGDEIINFFGGLAAGDVARPLHNFLIDSMMFPALPDFFLLVIYSTNPGNAAWGAALLGIAVFASFSGNSLLYLIVKKYSPPNFIKKLMKRYSKMLVVKDEKILLINRVAPVLPYTGAFIAVNNWDYWKAITYIVVGAAIKFGFLILLSERFTNSLREELQKKRLFVNCSDAGDKRLCILH